MTAYWLSEDDVRHQRAINRQVESWVDRGQPTPDGRTPLPTIAEANADIAAWATGTVSLLDGSLEATSTTRQVIAFCDDGITSGDKVTLHYVTTAGGGGRWIAKPCKATTTTDPGSSDCDCCALLALIRADMSDPDKIVDVGQGDETLLAAIERLEQEMDCLADPVVGCDRLRDSLQAESYVLHSSLSNRNPDGTWDYGVDWAALWPSEIELEYDVTDAPCYLGDPDASSGQWYKTVGEGVTTREPDNVLVDCPIGSPARIRVRCDALETSLNPTENVWHVNIALEVQHNSGQWVRLECDDLRSAEYEDGVKGLSTVPLSRYVYTHTPGSVQARPSAGAELKPDKQYRTPEGY